MLEVSGLTKRFGAVEAVRGVSLSAARGSSLGIVGESGSGKTTLVHCVLRLIEPDSGTVTFDGSDVAAMNRTELRSYRQRIQLVFQDAGGSLNPRMRIGPAVAEPLIVHGMCTRTEVKSRVEQLLGEVGLAPASTSLFPTQLSGGERQRAALARALALDPDVLVLDEPVSALDTSVQAQVLNLLRDLRAKRALTLVLVSHDIAVVRYLCDELLVMYSGNVVEEGPTNSVIDRALHPYTHSLIASVPTLGGSELTEAPHPEIETSGVAECDYFNSCRHPAKNDRCITETPELRTVGHGRVACHHARAPGS